MTVLVVQVSMPWGKRRNRKEISPLQVIKLLKTL